MVNLFQLLQTNLLTLCTTASLCVETEAKEVLTDKDQEFRLKNSANCEVSQAIKARAFRDSNQIQSENL